MSIDFARFSFEKDHTYELNQIVPVWLQEKEIIGSATVVEIKPTALLKADGERVPLDDIKFEFCEQTKDKYATFSPYYAGMTSKLCLYDVVKYKELEKQRERERIAKLKQQPLNNKLLCNNCDSLIAASKKPRTNKCPVCKRGQLITV
jgi:hypothetical protein